MAISRQTTYELPTDLQELPKDWRYEPLGSLVDLDRGISYGVVQPGTSDPLGVPIVRVNNLKQGRIITDDVLRINKDIESKYQRSRLKGGEVLLTLVGTLGECAIVPDNLSGWNVARAVAVIPVKPQISARWVYFCLRLPQIQHYIKIWATTTVQATFNLRDVAKLPIPIAPQLESEAIAHILGTLDDKIELNREMNQTLEAMARAIFKSWFVDFDPVRAKMEGRLPAGMDLASAELFPSEFEESVLGMIPKGWCVCELGNLARNVSKTFDFSARSEVIFINTGDVLLGSFLHSNRISKDGLPGQAKKSIKQNDILMTEIRPANGRYAYVDFDSTEYVVSTKFMIISASDDIEPRLLYRILTLEKTLAEFQLIAESRSGTFPQITFDSISYFPIIVAPKTIQLAFLKVVDLLEKQIKINNSQSRSLASIRDALLPKLLSGEIRVKEAEKIAAKTM